ncbi:protein kinase [Candidatus Uabimicrobium sp. HlEnr_7]|uniref:protein kinase domain-containing protein n=1 Tax=Candidatus Uabimicrobium helgolandensis TaxID=3095367 RepID=UPI003557AE2A
MKIKRGSTLVGCHGKNYTLEKLLRESSTITEWMGIRSFDQYTVRVIQFDSDYLDYMFLQFIYESSLITKLSHKNIIQGLDIMIDKYSCYCITEFCNNDPYCASVGDFIEEEVLFLDVIEATKIILEVAYALEYLELNNIIHGDIRPENIYYTSGIVKLVNSGFMRKTDGVDLIKECFFIGGVSPYISPDSQESTHSDMYSLGAMYYHMIVGEVPFPGDNPIDLHIKRLKQSPQPQRVKPNLPEGVCVIIEKMMKINPQNRYRSTKHLIVDLKKIIC